MEFRVLGPLEVVDGRRSLPLGGAKPRSVLAVLLLHANETVTSEKLIDELWGGTPPETAAKALQGYVSNLRKTLPPDVILTRPRGYAIELEPEQLDRTRFERALAEGRHALARGHAATAAELLRDALALWRGQALADFASDGVAQAEIARLEELRLVAHELRHDAELALGRHAELVGELESIVAAHPLRERLHAQLMLALYRSGRQADALRVYAERRRALVDELGIEPGPELQQLQQAILRQDEALLLARPAPVVVEPTRGFVGRESELAELLRLLDEVFRGRGRIALVRGEPGIGKSRLAEELGHHARGRGAAVLVGHCWEDGGAPAYWPWPQILRAAARQRHEALPVLLSESVGPRSGELEGGARFRLFDEVASYLRAAAQTQPLVVVLDDLHAADESALLLLRFLSHELVDARIFVVATYRDVDPTLADPLASTLAELVRQPSVERLALTGLDERAVADYIEAASGSEADAAVVRAVVAQTEGNPFFAGETVRLLIAEGRLDDAAAARAALPDSVREAIGRRLARLSDDCRSLLETASVLGRDFDLATLARAAGVEPGDAVATLDGAVETRIVLEVPGSVTRLRFAHALVRDVVYDTLTIARRAELHERAGNALAELHVSDPGAHLAALAHHFFEASRRGDRRRAVDYARRAAERASALLAYEEAARLYRMALELDGGGVVRCELLLALGDALGRAGETRAANDAFREAADLAQLLEQPEQLARAALGYGGRLLWQVSRDDALHAALLERALAALGENDHPLRARLLARLAGGPLRDASADPDRRRRLACEAIEIARRIGEPRTLAHALHGYISANMGVDFTPEQLELASEFVQLAQQTGERERELEAHELRFGALLELGDAAAASDELAAMVRLEGEIGQPAQAWFTRTWQALLALHEARLEAASQLVEAARQLGDAAENWSATVSYHLQLYVLRLYQNRLGELDGVVQRSVADHPTYPVWRCVRAHLDAHLGRTASASAALSRFARGDFDLLSRNEEWLVSASLLAETAHSVGHVELARLLYERLLPYEDRVAVAYAEISLGAVARYLGLLAAVLGRRDEAARHFETALAVNERTGARAWLAATQRDYAEIVAPA